MKSGKVVDVAVASDRSLDRIRIYAIDGSKPVPLTDITRADPPRAFRSAPRPTAPGWSPTRSTIRTPPTA